MRTRRRWSVARSLLVSTLLGLSCGVALVVDPGVARAQEGSWAPTGSLTQGRFSHTTTLLLNGHVLAAGGHTATTTLNSAELYNPLTETWSPTGPMATGRWSHTATLLPDGRVLVAGGFGEYVPNANAQPVLDSVELYDPATGTWAPAPPMNVRRALHSAALLEDGRVLVAGGRTCNAPPPTACNFTFRTATAEIFDPATGTWTFTGSMTAERHTTSAAVVAGGKVLVPGGFSNESLAAPSQTADLYDPATGTWARTGNLNAARARQGAMVLPDGTVLVAAGTSRNTTSETFSPATSSWHLAGDVLLAGRYNFRFAVLPNGKALVAAGVFPVGTAAVLTRTAEVFDPATRTWSSAGTTAHDHGDVSALGNSRPAVVLSASPWSFEYGAACGANCGKVLVDADNSDGSAELYTPGPPLPATTAPACFVSGLFAGPPRQQEVTVQDPGSGLAGVVNIRIVNGTVNVQPFTPGTRSPVRVTATKTDPSRPTVWSFDVVDVAGNVRHCA